MVRGGQYRKTSRFDPIQSARLVNPAKLLLDPYARDVVGAFVWRDEQFGADRHYPLDRDERDNAAFALKARVMARMLHMPEFIKQMCGNLVHFNNFCNRI